MLVGAADTSDIVIALISTVSAISVAGISAWAAVQVSRATTTQATKVADLEARLQRYEHGENE